MTAAQTRLAEINCEIKALTEERAAIVEQARRRAESLDGIHNQPGEVFLDGVSAVIEELIKAEAVEQSKQTAHANIDAAPTRVLPEMVACDCGHECGAAMVMSASMGTSCPDCYDTLSD
jgi:hypothetical protein